MAEVPSVVQDPVDWDMAHGHIDYLDMVKVKYRTFQIECPKFEIVAKLPSMFVEEFTFELHMCNKVVDRYGNEFEVIVEKRNGALCFTHGWSDILGCYVDADGKGVWASITYIRPKLFVLTLRDRYYRDLIVKHIHPSLCLNLSRSLFGSDKNPSWFGNVPLPYWHETRNFAHNFIVILSDPDVRSGLLTINYGRFASKHLAKDAECVKLIDEKGFEWRCTVKFNSHPFDHLDIGGDWGSMVRIRNYQIRDHIMFGSPMAGNACELFVKKI